MRRTSPRRRLGWLLIALAIVGVVAFLRTRTAWDEACNVARKQLPSLLNADVLIGRCELDPLTQTAKLYEVSARHHDEERPFFAADLLEVQLSAVQPFFGEISLGKLRVERPRIEVDLSTPAPPKPVTPPSASKRGCAVDTLKRVKIDRLEIEGAELRLALPGGRRVELLGVNAGWRTRRGVSELTVDVRDGSAVVKAGARPLAIGRAKVEGALDLDGDSLELGRAEADIHDVTVSLTGKVEELCHPRLFLDAEAFVPLKTVARALESSTPMAGHTWTRLVVSGAASEPTVAVDLVATGVELGRFKPGDFTAQVTIANHELRLGEVSFPTGPGALKVGGRVGLREPYPISLQASAEGAELGHILDRVGIPHAWVDLFATGKVNATGQLRPSFELSGEADLKIARFSVAGRPFDTPSAPGKLMLQFAQGTVKTPVRVLADRVELLGAQVTSGLSAVKADAELYFDQEKGIEITGAGELDLSDFGQVAELPWEGRGHASFKVAGPYKAIAIEGETTFNDFKFWDLALGHIEGKKISYRDRKLSFPTVFGQKGSSAYSGHAELNFAKKQTEVDGGARFASAQLADLVDVIVGLHPSIDIFQGPLKGGATLDLAVKGPTETFNGKIDLTLNDVSYFGRRLGDGRIGLKFEDGNALVLDAFELDRWEGETLPPVNRGKLTADGRWEFGARPRTLSYEFRGTGLDLAEWVGPERAKEKGIEGVLALKGEVSGDTDTPKVQGTLKAPEIRYAHRSLGKMDLQFDIVERAMTVTGSAFTGAEIQPAKLTLRAPIPFTLDGKLQLDDLGALLTDEARAQGVTGLVRGGLHAEGNLKDPSSIQLSARVDQAVLSRADFRAQTDDTVQLTYGNGVTTVAPFTVRMPNNTTLSGEGTFGDDKLDAKLQGTLDVRLVESFVSSIERTRGTVEIGALSISGKMNRPVFAGRGVIRDAGLTVRDRGITLRNVSGDLEFVDQSLLFDVNGVLNDGRLSLRGGTEFDRGLKKLSVNATLEEVKYRATEELPLVASGVLDVEGNLDKLDVAGSLDLSRVVYEKPLVLETFVANLAKPKIAYAPGEKPREWIWFRDLGINLADVRVDNNLAKATLTGRLKLTGSNVNPGLLGVVESGDNSQAFFRGNRFDIRKGQLSFNDRKQIESMVDLHLETQVREYTVSVHAFGRTDHYNVIWRSDPALPEADILALLTLGVTSRDAAENAQAAATGLAADALLSATGFDRQVQRLQRLLPKDGLLLNPQVHINTSYNESSGMVEPLASLESRLLWDDLKLSMTRPFSGRGTRVNLEYQFKNGLSAQGQWDENSEAHSPVGNIGLDLKLRWEVE